MNIVGFAICMNNEGYSASLELRKIYPVIQPETNDPVDYIRIVDESDEDYLFPADWFESVSLGAKLESRLMESVVV
jgi:hypothetical protein